MYNQTKRKRLAAKANIVRRRDNRQTILLFGVVPGLVGTFSRKTLQTGPNRKAIHRDGRTVDAAVAQIKGRSYTDVENLARV